MRRASFALVLLLVAPLAFAQVYKWTDAKGTTHYSETPPSAGTKYTQVTLNADQPAAAAPNSASADTSNAGSGNSSDTGGNAPAKMADTPENRSKLCASLKTNIAALQGSGPVVMQSGGKQQLLNPDQRKQQLDSSQSQYNQYCANQQ